MVAFTVSTLLNVLFVRSAIVSAADAVGATTLDLPPYHTELSENTFEWLKTVTLIAWTIGDDKLNYHPITQDDPLVQKALGAWATVIKDQIAGQGIKTQLAPKDIVLSRKEVNERLGTAIVWKHDGLGRMNRKIRHLIIRRIDVHLYEWMGVYQSKESLRPALDAPLQLSPVSYAMSFSAMRFTAFGSNEKRLTEICSAFAEQQMQHWQREVDRILQQIQEYSKGHDTLNEGNPVVELMFYKEFLYETFEDLQGIRRREREKLENKTRDLEQEIQNLEEDLGQEEDLENQRAETQRQLDDCQRAANNVEQEFHRKEKETNHWIMIASLIGGSVMLFMIGIFVFVLCRRAGKGIIETSEEMKRELGAKREKALMNSPLPNRQPGSVAIHVAEIDPRFRCSQDPHSILADENGQVEMHRVEEFEVNEQEGIEISAVTRQSTTANMEEG